MLPAFVDGPPAQEQRGGLVTNALNGDQSVDWLKGVQWWPEDVAGWQLASECVTTTINHGDVGVPQPVAAQPFLIRTNVQGPKSSHLDLSARADRRLRSITSQAVARELWLGEMAQAAPFDLDVDYSWSNPATAGLTTPTGLTATPSTTGGTLAAGTYYYRVSATNAYGETLAAAQVSATTTGSTSSVALSWTAVTGATGYRVYRSGTSGSWAGPNARLASPASNAYTDTGGTALSAGAPVASSTAVSGQYVTPYLASGQATDIGLAGADPDTAVAAVEEALSELVAGGPLFLHMPQSVVMQLGAQLTRNGDYLTTPSGSVVIADYGYPGGGNIIYGTGPVTVWLGQVAVYGQPNEYVRVSDNHIEVWADRPALALFDPETLVSCAVTA